MAFDTAAQSETPQSLGTEEHHTSEPSSDTTAAGGADQQASNRPPGNRAQAAQRRERVARVRPSMPFLTSNVILNSHPAQRVFKRVYQQGAESLHTLAVLVRIVATQEEAVEVDALVNQEMQTVVDEMKADVARLEQLAESNGLHFAGVTYSASQTVTAQITSPRCAMLLQMIRDLDKQMGMLDAVWLSHLISDREYNAAVSAATKRLFRLGGHLRNLAYRSMSSAQRNGVENVQDPRSGTPLDPDVAPASAAVGVDGGQAVAADPDAAPAAPVARKRTPKQAAQGADEAHEAVMAQEPALAS